MKSVQVVGKHGYDYVCVGCGMSLLISSRTKPLSCRTCCIFCLTIQILVTDPVECDGCEKRLECL